MSSFPACRHRERSGDRAHGLSWLASEPYRVFFFSGAVWSVIGVLLWPLFYLEWIDFFPGFAHARLMIEAFGGAFVVGFLGTAGPRMVEAPKLTSLELIGLFLLHQSSAIAHLTLQLAWGDALFAVLLGSLLMSLVVRVIWFRKEPPPPQLLLALSGLLCGTGGAVLLVSQETWIDPGRLRFANLLLYQGLLLPPILGIGSFLFPRMLGGDFGDRGSAAQGRAKFIRAAVALLVLVASFWIEAYVNPIAGYGLRALIALACLLVEVSWKPKNSGSLTTGLFVALLFGFTGLVLAPFFVGVDRVSVEHMLYIGGFGVLMLVVGSRVLFGHSGHLEEFFAKSKWVRFLVFLGVLAAATRVTPAWAPTTTASHHVYAALTWGLLVSFWLLWHRRRFAERDGG